MPETLLPNISDFIAHVSPLDSLPSSLQKVIASHISITWLGTGETLPFDTDAGERYLYIIRTGALEQRWRGGGLRAKLGPHDLFGFTFLEGIPGNPADCYNVTAIENTLLYRLPHSMLKTLLTEHPQFATHFSVHAHERLRSAMKVAWSAEEKGLYIRKVSEVAQNTLAVVSPETSILLTAKAMQDAGQAPVALVGSEQGFVGIVSDHDMTQRVVATGHNIHRPVSDIMSPSPVVVAPDELIMHAVSLMSQHDICQLPVVSHNRAVGVLTASQLVRQHRMQAIVLIEKINACKHVAELVALSAERQAIFEALVEGSLRSDVVELAMTTLMDAFTRKILLLGIAEQGTPPCEFVWIVSGSHARQEVHISSDQDNALILADDATEQDLHWFTTLAAFVCDGLNACGYPLCSGKYMAVTRRWCQPLKVWQEYFRKWAKNPEYSRLMNATVFLETRAVYGNTHLWEKLQRSLLDAFSSQPAFLRSLTRDAVQTRPPLGIFNHLVLETSGNNSKTLNIKRNALTPVIDLARIYGLASGCTESSTQARFTHARDHGLIAYESCTNILDAFHFLSRLRLTHQLRLLRLGLTADNDIDPKQFGSFERKHLKDAFRIIASQQDAARLRFVKE